MTLEISDMYETFDQKFKSTVPKTHSDVVKLMQMYTDLTQNNVKKKKRSVGLDKYLEYILGTNNSVSCPICFTKFAGENGLVYHKKHFHNKGGRPKNPYNIIG